MLLLYFSDLLTHAGIDPKKTLLVRHTLSNKIIRTCYEQDKTNGNDIMMMSVTREQDCGFSNGFDYWAVFISDHGTLCKFYGLFKVGSAVPNTHDIMPAGYDQIDPNAFRGNRLFYDLDRIEILKEYENRLIINWGNNVRKWAQKGTIEKNIVAIQSSEVFCGYEDVILSFDELEKITQNPTIYNEYGVCFL